MTSVKAVHVLPKTFFFVPASLLLILFQLLLLDCPLFFLLLQFESAVLPIITLSENHLIYNTLLIPSCLVCFSFKKNSVFRYQRAHQLFSFIFLISVSFDTLIVVLFYSKFSFHLSLFLTPM